MRKAILILAAILCSGCPRFIRKAVPHLTPDSYIACQRYGFCGPHAGKYMEGSAVCYVEDVSKPRKEWNTRCW